MDDERASKGYDDKKIFRCVSCGTDVEATKFASAAKVQCDRCKRDKKQPDPGILAEIQASKKNKSTVSPSSGATKTVPCIKCGNPATVSKFMSDAKAVCDDCRGVIVDAGTSDVKLHIDMSKLDKDKIPNEDELFIVPTIINNPRLRKVTCPACGEQFMKIIKILDSSPESGLVIVYQCKECWTGITLSEQIHCKLTPVPMQKMFNYRGEQILGFVDGLEDTRVKNTIEYLMRLLDDNHIDIPGAELSEGVGKPMHKKIPVGINVKGDVEDESSTNEQGGKDS